MGDVLDDGALDRWRREPARFIAEVIRDPETGKPFELLPAERVFLEHAYRTDDAGRLLYPEQVYSCPKKSGNVVMMNVRMIDFSRYAERRSQRSVGTLRFAHCGGPGV
jgi:hypothetical protein